jgi:hypothetical protein
MLRKLPSRQQYRADRASARRLRRSPLASGSQARRGKRRATAEWNLAVTVANLFKAITTSHLTRDALITLAT